MLEHKGEGFIICANSTSPCSTRPVGITLSCQFVKSNLLPWNVGNSLWFYLANNSIRYNPIPVLEAILGEKDAQLQQCLPP